MARQIIDIGTTANDGTGDPIRTAFDKTNDNFAELYAEVTDICRMHDLTFAIPSGWWDSGDRVTVTSLLSSTSSFAIICNWSPLVMYAGGKDGSLWDISEAGTGVTWGGSVQTIQDLTVNDNDAVQANAALQGVLGRAPVGGWRNLITNSDFAGSVNGNLGSGGALPNGWVQFSPVGEIVGSGIENGLGYFDLRISGSGSTNFSNLLVRNSPSSITPAVTSLYSRIIDNPGGLTAHLTLSDSAGTGSQADTLLTADMKRFVTVKQSGTVGQFRFSVNVTGSGDWSFTLRFAAIQHELGLSDTPYQRVVSTLDITEAGVPSTPFLRLDLSDDAYPAAVPDGTYDVFVAGRGGSWIERDVVVSGGAGVTIGPTGIAGRNAGILSALGGNPGNWADVVENGVAIVEGTIDPDHLAWLVKRAKANGAKGLLVPGPEKVTNGTADTDVSGWATIGASTTLTWDAGEMLVSPGATFEGVAQSLTVGEGSVYQLSYDARGIIGASPGRVRSSFAGFSNISITDNSAAVAVNAFVVAASSGPTNLRFDSSNVSSDFYLDNISVRELRPEEDW